MAGYCEAFSALCSLACKERRQSENVDIVEDDTKKDIEGNIDDGIDDPLQQQEPKTTGGCANTAAKSVALAGASCECLGYSLTDRVNFAIIGGIVSLKDKPTANFAAEGFLDGLSFLPRSPIFMSIIHVMQTVCGYVTLLANISSPPETPVHHDGGFLGTIAGLVPGLANLIPGVSTVSGLLPMFGGLVGGSGTKPDSANNENKSNGKEANVVSTKTSTAAPAATTAAKASSGGGIFGWLSHLFMETEGPEQQILGSTASASAPSGNSKYEQENSRLVSKDGKIAQITRIQKRKNKTKTVITAEKQHVRRRDDL
ncbi:hypothetical protein BGZ98_008329 [Dissophora globulifera]|nr:hypothetical protein BGZ98_008329 [Dissophora globulifera]